jgi:uncharacterized protein YyaL (SSP411 family)
MSQRAPFAGMRFPAWPSVVVVALLWGAFTETCHAQPNGDASVQFAAWGAETLDAIKRDLWMGDRGFYAEQAQAGGERSEEPAFLWGAGVQLTALAAAAQVEPSKYAVQLAEYADALEKHWIDHKGIGGYSVLPEQAVADRYYDDNVWVVLALVETMEATGDEKYLDRAQRAMQFVLSGEDDELGGGIYWRENRRNSKNTCSNAPAIVAALRLYQKTSNAQHLGAAERLYDWTCAKLQDDEDGLFWDNLRLNGRLDRRKYSYNSALMIRANCLLFEVKGEEKYLDEAQRIARSAVARWIVPESGAVKDGGRFAHLLLESLLAVGRLDGDAAWLDAVAKSARFVHENVRDANGRYAHSWDRRQADPLESFQLIDQASAARAYFVVARTMNPTSTAPPK